MIDYNQIKLNFRNKIPLSDQLQKEVRQLIQDGKIRPGDQLPAVRTLAAQLNINFNTIARAYRALDQEGLISTQQGRGTYVLEETTESDQEQPSSREDHISRLIDKMLEEAGRFDIKPAELLNALKHRLDSGNQKTLNQYRQKARIQKKQRKSTPSWYREWIRMEEQSGKAVRRLHRKKARRKLHHLFHVKHNVGGTCMGRINPNGTTNLIEDRAGARTQR